MFVYAAESPPAKWCFGQRRTDINLQPNKFHSALGRLTHALAYQPALALKKTALRFNRKDKLQHEKKQS